MLQKMSNEKALNHLDVLMGKVSMAKASADLEDAAENGVIPGTPAGTEEIPVTKDTEPCNKDEEKNPAEGEFSAEKHQDLKDSTGGDEVEDTEANKDGKADPVATDFNADSIDKESGEKSMNEKNRVLALGAKINEKLEKKASEAPKGGFDLEKLSAEEQEAVLLFKQAADAHYIDYVESFAKGMQKKAEDVEAIMEAKGIPEEEAVATLDEIAAEDPSLVIPEEAGAEEVGVEGELSPEDEAMLVELASELEAAGVTPEELAAAVEGVDAEDAAAVDVEKVASGRHEQLKAIVRKVRG